MDMINQNEKTLVFCATQDHALAVRDLINQMKTSTDPNYCQRVTANDGALGEQHLRDFQDNEKTIPTILTTSQKLSTGVDARNIRNIVLMRPINSMIEFKQIIGRGTRLYDGKDYFTIYDFVKAHHHFSDPEWDGEPLEPEPCQKCGCDPCVCEVKPPQPCADLRQAALRVPERAMPGLRQASMRLPASGTKVKVKLADGKERTIQHMMVTTFWHPDGTPMSAQQFMEMLFGKLPEFFKRRGRTARPLERPGHAGQAAGRAGRKGLRPRSTGRDAEDHRRREERPVRRAGPCRLCPAARSPARSGPPRRRCIISTHFNAKQQAFLDFVLSHYVSVGVEELDQDKLTPLLRLKYHDSIADAVADLGSAKADPRGLSAVPEVPLCVCGVIITSVRKPVSASSRFRKHQDTDAVYFENSENCAHI